MIDAVEVRVYTVPTDAPEGDGTLAWDATTTRVSRDQRKQAIRVLQSARDLGHGLTLRDRDAERYRAHS